jgi:hypothetical protein
MWCQHRGGKAVAGVRFAERNSMIKHPFPNAEAVSITFELPASVAATTAAICGEFNHRA